MARVRSLEIRRRRSLQWALSPIVIVTIALGWRYPLLGYSVPVVMATGIVGGLFKGRYVCGNICPRGGLVDRLLSRVSNGKPIPPLLKHMTFRWFAFVALMGFMLFQMGNKPPDADWLHHIGKVFWRICLITTALCVVLGILIHQRSWCSFCPEGTLQSVWGKGKYQLHINAKVCKECGLCERSCPLGLRLLNYKSMGKILDPDCLRCPECAGACPQKALGFTATG